MRGDAGSSSTLDDSPTAEQNADDQTNGDRGQSPSAGGARSKSAQPNSAAANQEGEAPPPHNRLKRLLLIGAVVVALIALLAVGLIPRLRRQREVEGTAQERAGAAPQVNVVRPRRAPETNELLLPGTAQAAQETVVSARTSGFVRRYSADIGDRVRTGQVLAEIDTPELDQQLRQARQEVDGAVQQLGEARANLQQARAGLVQAEANYGQARTNSELARVTLNRSKYLTQRGLVSRQENDERQAQFDVRIADSEVALAGIKDRQANIAAQQAVISSREANVRALQANVQRLVELSSFKRVVAPFDGVITARNIDVGSLVSASGGVAGAGNMVGNSAAAAGDATNASPGGLFRLARTNTIRTYVNVPQTFATAIFSGLQAEVSVSEIPEQKFAGKVVRTNSSIDPSSRTLLAEVLISNESGKLLPGMFTQVRFALPQPNARAVIVPASALSFRAEGAQIIMVRDDGTVHFQAVEVGRDYGKELEIVGGLSADDLIVTNPTDGLVEGTRVETREAPAGAQTPGGQNQGGGGRPPGGQQSK